MKINWNHKIYPHEYVGALCGFGLVVVFPVLMGLSVRGDVILGIFITCVVGYIAIIFVKPSDYIKGEWLTLNEVPTKDLWNYLMSTDLVLRNRIQQSIQESEVAAQKKTGVEVA